MKNMVSGFPDGPPLWWKPEDTDSWILDSAWGESLLFSQYQRSL